MNTITKFAVVGSILCAFGVDATAANLNNADLNGAVMASLGEFDRVGASPSLPKAESGKPRKNTPTKLAQSPHNREMNAQKVEFVRRMFWVALSMR